MSRLLETIRVSMYRAFWLEWHFRRVLFSTGSERTARAIIGLASSIVHRETGRTIRCPGRYRLSIEYEHDTLIRYTITPYARRQVFACVACEPRDASHRLIEYRLKYADRSALNETARNLATGVEPLYVRNGLVLEARYANVAFLRRGQWFTPRTVMHAGTARARLLGSGILQEADIYRAELCDFDAMCFVNAMLDPGELVISPNRVYTLPSA